MIKFVLVFLSSIAISCSHVLLQTASGDVTRGNFIYWSLNYHGNIIVQLISLSGDTDLYVSERIAKPDYDPEKYDLQSASCGTDTVLIPSSFKRPVGIGIYGHPSYENSTYLLEIYYDETEDELSYENEVINDSYQSNGDENGNDPKAKFKATKNMFVSGLWAVMEILELMFS